MKKKPIPLEELPVLDNQMTESPTQLPFAEGVIILMNKPVGFSSFDVVKFVRNRIPVRKVGHAGTLDPLASGLLILCCGKATKSISLLQELPKTYLAEITFGASTPSFDKATEVDGTASWNHINRKMIDERLAKSFTGIIEQVPPVFSALKKDGKRYYKLARKGETFIPDPRTVEIYETRIVSCELPGIKMEVKCGKGTYIRSLAHDLGKECDSLAYLSSLVRTGIGRYSVENAHDPASFNDWSKSHG